MGPGARFNFPTGLVVDPRGNRFIADTNNATIRELTADGVVKTIAGTPGTTGILLGLAPRLSAPRGLAIFGDSLVITDSNAVLLLRHAIQ